MFAVLLVALSMPTVAAGAAKPPAGAEPTALKLNAYESDFGVSQQTAERHLAVQERATEIVSQLKAIQGKRYAGVWFDNETGEFVVPVLSSTNRSLLDASLADAYPLSDVRNAPAQYSWEELEAAHERIDESLGSLIEDGLVQTSLDPRSNAVVIHEAEAVSKQEQAQIKALANGAPVEVEIRSEDIAHFKAEPFACHIPSAVCDRPLRAGVFMEPAGPATAPTCTAGFKAIGNTFGNRFVLTAGHCYAASQDWASWDATTFNSHYIGPIEQAVYPGGDYSKIRVNGYGTYWEEVPWPSTVVFWGGDQNIPITHESSSYMGQSVCHSGWTTKSSCGTVTAFDKTVAIGGLPVYHLSEASGSSFFADHGDSGGPFWAGNTALGLLSGGIEGDLNLAYYTEITEATAALGVSVGSQVGAPPSVETTPPGPIGGYDATGNGKVDPNGLPTSFHFDYGTTPGLGSSTQDWSAGSSLGAVSVSGTISNLQPVTTYYYRIVASNGAGINYGLVQGFTTTTVPPKTTGQPPTFSPGKATLRGNVNPGGLSTKYRFEWGTTEAYGNKVPVPDGELGASGTTKAVEHTISGLQEETKYYYRLYAQNSKGSDETKSSFTTPRWRPSVTTKGSSGITETESTISGTVNPNGTETKYLFEYGFTSSYGTKTSEVSAGSGTSNVEVSKALTGLDSGTTYHYRIAASNSWGPANGADAVFTTRGAPRNRTLPVASPTPPYQGSEVKTTDGTWSREPESYSYQWRRCNGAGGECTDIGGATKSTYTPVEADVGHTLVARVTATVTDGSTNAFSLPAGRVKGPIIEYSLPSGSQPEGIAWGPDGNLWYANKKSSKIGKITTAGVITEYALPAGSEPESITAGPNKENALWFTADAKNKIGKITTAGAITEFAGPSGGFPHSITVGSDNNLWFLQTDKINKMTTGGTITQYSLPATSVSREIAPGPDGNLWFTNYLLESSAGRIGKITPGGTITEYPMSEESNPFGIAAGPDGNMWFTNWGPGDGSNRRIGKITTSGVISEYNLNTPTRPDDITPGPEKENAMWFTSTYGVVGKITTSGVINEYRLPIGASSNDITAGPDGKLWFTVFSGKIGKIEPAKAANVITEAASAATESKATLNGTVNPNGEETKYYFEYGPTTSYGTKTPEVSAGSGTGEVPVKQTVSGLTASTTYHVRLVATNSLGTFYGADLTFSTLGKPSADPKAATGLAQTEATLNGIVNPRGAETKYFFEYGKTTSYGTKTAEVSVGSGTKDVEVSKTITGLEVGATYHFRVVATNSSGTRQSADESFHSPTWSVLETPTPSGSTSGSLAHLSCASSTACLAVGSFKNSAGTTVPLAEIWDGTKWAVQEPPIPAEAKESWLSGVSCTAPTECVAAAGLRTTAGVTLPLAGTWDGTNWSLQELPLPAGAIGNSLQAVSCASSSSCVAIGSFRNSSAVDKPFAEIWNGTSWSAQQLPVPAGTGNSYLEDVFCTSATACIAVGTFANGSLTKVFADTWNGSTWTAKELPNVAFTKNSYLEGITCTSSTSCIAVGYFSNSSNKFIPLIETLSGTTWSAKEGPLPAGALAGNLRGVSCTALGVCIAAGQFTNSASKIVPLAESWNGTTWSVIQPPFPAGSTTSYMDDVACVLPRSCLGVGRFHGVGAQVLTEQYQ